MVNIKNYKYYIIIITAFILASCVQSVENPYEYTSDKPVINILHPVSGEFINMGITTIMYQAADFTGGSGLSYYNLFVNGQFIQSFPQNEDGTNPNLFFHSDTLENRLGFDPYNWPSEISYAMTVVNKNGAIGETSLIDSVFVDRKPATPGTLILTRITDMSFNLFWDDLATNETKYEIWRQDGSNNAFVHIKDVAANTISTNDLVDTDYISYGYQVRSANGFGNSGFSNIVYSGAVPGGDAPSDLEGEALGASTIKLTWTDNTDDEDGFKIERKNLITGIFKMLVILPRNTTEYFDNDLSLLTTYDYRVASFTSSSVSAFSNSVTISTYGQDVPAPANLQATYDPVMKVVGVFWDDNTFLENGTIVERKETINGEYVVIGSTGTDQNLFFDGNIIVNQIYYYRARFKTTVGFKTTYSNVDTAYVYPAPPISPTNLQINKFSDIYYGLSWEDNSDNEEGFEIWRKTGDTGTYVLHKKLLPNTIAYNDSVASGITYYFKVRAFRASINSSFSNEVNTEEGNGGEFPAPSNLSAQIVNNTNVQLNWINNGTDEAQIIVERKLQTEFEFSEVNILAPGTTTWTDENGLYHSLTLFYRIKTKYPQGDSEYSSELIVFIP